MKFVSDIRFGTGVMVRVDTRGGLIAALMLAVGVISAVATADLFRRASPLTTRVKITVTAEVGGQSFTGSSVQEFTVRRGGDLVNAGMQLTGSVGEAALIRLPGGAGVAVLVGSHNGSDPSLHLATMSCVREAMSTEKRSDAHERWRALEAFEGPCLLDAEAVPLSVFLPSLETPDNMTIIWSVDPESLGIRMVGARIERSSEPISRTIHSDLQWLTGGVSREKVPIAEGGFSSLGRAHFVTDFSL